MADAPLTGRLLVATPSLRDPNFARAVVMVLEHGPEGALGVILNRASEVGVPQALAAWEHLLAEPPVMFLGGPVQPGEAVIGLARLHNASAAALVLPGLGVVDLAADPAVASVDFSAVRLFAGYAGWGAGQLEAELEAGGWFLVDAHPDDPFTARPTGLWRQVLRRQGGVFATVTENPSLN